MSQTTENGKDGCEGFGADEFKDRNRGRGRIPPQRPGQERNGGAGGRGPIEDLVLNSFAGPGPLFAACAKGEVHRVERLLSRGLSPASSDVHGTSALHHAAASGSGELCLLLVGFGADPNGRDRFGRTPLHTASEAGSVSACLALASAGADPEALDGRGQSALALAGNEDAYSALVGIRSGRTGASKAARAFSRDALGLVIPQRVGNATKALPGADSAVSEIAKTRKALDERRAAEAKTSKAVESAAEKKTNPQTEEGSLPASSAIKEGAAGEAASASAESNVGCVRVFSASSAAAVAAWAKTYPGDNKSLLERCGKEMAAGGGSRRAVAPADPAKALALLSSFPCFEGPIRDAAAAMAMQVRACAAGRARPAKLPNMLLVGPPGIGKTCFVQALGEALALPTETVRMNTSSGGFELCGLDSTWSGAKPGRIFEILARGACANPIIELDEVDKSGGGSSNRLGGSSEAPLFALLEADSARRWRDAFVDQEFDASFPSIVATANSLEGLSEPILSRFEIHEIPDPTEEQRRSLALLVWAKALSEEGLDGLFPSHPGEAALERLAAMSPRAARRAAGRALGQACVEGRDELRVSDFGEAAAQAQARPIGFCFGGAAQ